MDFPMASGSGSGSWSGQREEDEADGGGGGSEKEKNKVLRGPRSVVFSSLSDDAKEKAD